MQVLSQLDTRSRKRFQLVNCTQRQTIVSYSYLLSWACIKWMLKVEISVSQSQPYWLNQFEKNWKEHSFEFIKNLILNRFLLVIYIRIFLSFRKQKLPCSSHVMKQSSSPAESSAHFIAAIFNNNQTVVWVGGVSGRFHHTYNTSTVNSLYWFFIRHRQLALTHDEHPRSNSLFRAFTMHGCSRYKKAPRLEWMRRKFSMLCTQVEGPSSQSSSFGSNRKYLFQRYFRIKISERCDSQWCIIRSLFPVTSLLASTIM